MKKLIFLVFLFPVSLFGQTIFPFTDYNNFFQIFKDGYFTQTEHNPVSDLLFGDEFVAYCNSQRDFKVFDGEKTQLITNQIVKFKASDHLLAWNLGPIINYFENGKSHVITSFGGEYEVKDSLIVYEDTRYNTVNVIYKGKSSVLYQLTGDLYMPEAIGDNIIAFRDNGNLFKVFWRGKIYEFGVWNGQQKIEFIAGTDMLAFNDPTMRTFAIFENGQFLDVESIYVNKIIACRGFVVYEDVQGTLRYYGKGERKELASFFQFWDAKDDVVVWGEANSTFTLSGGEKKKVCNYTVKDWQLKNNVIAFTTNLGGVGAYINGEEKDITNMQNAEYVINNHSVMVTLSNKSVMILYNGQIYRN